MTCNYLRPSSLQHLGVFDSLLDGWKDTKLRCDRDRQVLMEGIDWIEVSGKK